MTVASRHTWEQFFIKRRMGLFLNYRLKFRFNWRPWRPVECIGGKVHFGRYVEVLE